jgi:hypothetical protein
VLLVCGLVWIAVLLRRHGTLWRTEAPAPRARLQAA